eukprot:TRINITY_DN15166_c0_g1_i1.p1 TRINITY_DN15166_c0_g1~~TRINITY_DN15166_c0_g1_i1.p1  ORF type:complete len:503 (-),score=115.99 TRINITY_DN15166_c0_g1_i1:74-1582(-)
MGGDISRQKLNDKLNIAVEQNDFKKVHHVIDLATSPRSKSHTVSSFSKRAYVCIAASQCDTQIIDALLSAGGDPNEYDERGHTPLMCAAMRTDHLALKAISLLLSHGAYANALGSGPMNGRCNALTYLLHNRCLSEYALRFGAKLLYDSGAQLYDYGPTEPLLLHLVAARAPVAAIDFVLDNGCDIDAVDGQRNTALHTLANDESQAIVAETLLLHGAGPQLSALNIYGKTPLAVVKNEAVMEVLMRAEADWVAAKEQCGSRLHEFVIDRVRRRLKKNLRMSGEVNTPLFEALSPREKRRSTMSMTGPTTPQQALPSAQLPYSASMPVSPMRSGVSNGIPLHHAASAARTMPGGTGSNFDFEAAKRDASQQSLSIGNQQQPQQQQQPFVDHQSELNQQTVPLMQQPDQSAAQNEFLTPEGRQEVAQKQQNMSLEEQLRQHEQMEEVLRQQHQRQNQPAVQATQQQNALQRERQHAATAPVTPQHNDSVYGSYVYDSYRKILF